MKEITIINKIGKLLETIDYEKIYLEIQTKNNKYIIDQIKEKNKIGFRKEDDNNVRS